MLNTEKITIRPVPGPGFIAACLISTWLATTPGGPVAFLLIGHPPLRRPGESAETAETGLLGMADAMGMRPAAEKLPHIGDRLRMRGPLVALDYGHPRYTLRIPEPGLTWQAHLAEGGAACITIGLDPIPPGAGPDATEAYLSRTVATGRAYMGTALLHLPKGGTR